MRCEWCNENEQRPNRISSLWTLAIKCVFTQEDSLLRVVMDVKALHSQKKIRGLALSTWSYLFHTIRFTARIPEMAKGDRRKRIIRESSSVLWSYLSFYFSLLVVLVLLLWNSEWDGRFKTWRAFQIARPWNSSHFVIINSYSQHNLVFLFCTSNRFT